MNILRINTYNNKISFKQHQKPNTDKKYYQYGGVSSTNVNYKENNKRDNTRAIFTAIFGIGCVAFAMLSKGTKY